MKRKSNIALYVIGVVLVVVAGVMLWAILNRQWVYDFWRGLNYQPVGEMERIRDDLGLTERGEFLFKAARPVLSSRSEFNDKCRTVLDEEMAVLGCYTNDDIYIYDIESAELDGIRELTTAHELLHAVWARMSEQEKTELATELAKVLTENQDFLEEEINRYAATEQQEELFVRAGTEVKKLPEKLEQLYGEIFRNQDAVVEFYDKYIAVFRRIEAEMEKLKSEMEALQAEIDAKTAEYENAVAKLNAEIAEFNHCAETAGCFVSEGVFYARRAELLNEQAGLEVLFNIINGLVDDYNVKVEQYNADVVHGDELNRKINSASEVEGL